MESVWKEGNKEEKKAGRKRRRRSVFTALLIFAVAFSGTACIIRVDTAAGSIIGNEPFFSSHFIRTGEREVDLKILGMKMRIVNGIVVRDD